MSGFVYGLLLVSQFSADAVVSDPRRVTLSVGLRGIDFTMFAGDSKVLVATAVDNAGEAVDITGAAITWAVARTVDDTAVLTKTSSPSAGIALSDPTAGEFEITLHEVDTDDLDGLYYHEAEMVLATDTSTVLTGNMIVERTLIRAP